MTHTHEFDCKICGAHLASRQELDQHNDQHLQESPQDMQASGRSASQGRPRASSGSQSRRQERSGSRVSSGLSGSSRDRGSERS